MRIYTYSDVNMLFLYPAGTREKEEGESPVDLRKKEAVE